VSEHQNERTAPRFAFREDPAITHLPLYPTPIREHQQVSGARKEAGWTGRQCIQPRKSSCKGSRSSYQWYVRNLKRATSSPANQPNRPLAETLALVRNQPSFSPFLFVPGQLTMASVVIPCLILGSINAWNLWNEHWEHWSHLPPLEERVEYPYQNIRTKNFFWGDGDKVSIFR
jgi:Cytochrome c oxidase subunit VIa